MLKTRNQSEIFESDIEFKVVSDSSILIKRDRAWIMFNFSSDPIFVDLENANSMEMINFFSSQEPILKEEGVNLMGKSCCILEE